MAVQNGLASSDDQEETLVALLRGYDWSKLCLAQKTRSGEANSCLCFVRLPPQLLNVIERCPTSSLYIFIKDQSAQGTLQPDLLSIDFTRQPFNWKIARQKLFNQVAFRRSFLHGLLELFEVSRTKS
jgi:hypothetical protein